MICFLCKEKIIGEPFLISYQTRVGENTSRICAYCNAKFMEETIKNLKYGFSLGALVKEETCVICNNEDCEHLKVVDNE